jgi:hypothetical protein
MAPLSALAGPINTKLLRGADPTFVLNVPVGKTVTVLNFFHVTLGQPCTLYVVFPSLANSIAVMNADHPDARVDNKDLTIDGPAQLIVRLSFADFCILTYKLFPN